MTKQNKKATATKKQNKKTVPAKKEAKTFLEYTADGKTIHEALTLTKAIRQKFLAEVYQQGANAEAINSIANKYGYSKSNFDLLASFPLKAELRKIDTIRPFTNKTRETLTPRMVAALVIAYLNREADDSFARVFPAGLFLENGCLTDLLTGGYITSKGGESEAQSFKFNLDKIKGLFTCKEYKALEKTMADACQI